MLLRAVHAGLLLIVCISIGNAMDYETQFRKALTCVEDATRKRLSVSLAVRGLNEEEIRASASMGISSSPFALFERDKGILVISPNACRAGLFPRARTNKEMDEMLFSLFLHELLHAYQQTVLDEYRQTRIPPRFLRCLCEGHAIVFSESLAQTHGVESTLTKLVCPFSNNQFALRSDIRRARLLHYFTYAIGSDYVRHTIRNVTDFPQLVGTSPTYRSILSKCRLASSPKDIVTGRHESTTSPPTTPKPIRTADVSVILKDLCGAYKIEAADLDYLDTMAVLVPTRFGDVDVTDAFTSGFRVHAHCTETPPLRVYFMTFDCHAIAGQLFRDSRSYFETHLAAREGDTRIEKRCPAWSIRQGSYVIASQLQECTLIFAEAMDEAIARTLMNRLENIGTRNSLLNNDDLLNCPVSP